MPVDGTYDDVNRLCLEIADETGWGFVNINLRPFYAEGSKTLAYEIAESLGWRSPDVVVAPVASGAMFTRLARGFEELVELGLIESRPIRFVGGQAAGCAPVATAWAAGTDVIEPVREPDTIVRSLAIGNPADGRYAVQLASESGGSIEAIEDVTTAEAIREVARLEGIYPETAGGVTLAAAAAARRRGVIKPGDEVVALLTGNGLKTPDARWLGATVGTLDGGRVGPGQPGLTPVIRPEPVGVRSVAGRRRGMSTVRIPPTLRTATGGEKRVEVEGATVRDCVSALVAAHPGLEAQLIGQDGDLNPFVNAFLNDTDIRHLEGLDTTGRRDGHARAAPGDGRRLTLNRRRRTSRSRCAAAGRRGRVPDLVWEAGVRSGAVQRPTEVSDQVVDAFDADRQADERRIDFER